MIEVIVFSKLGSTREYLMFSFDNKAELFILKKLLKNGAENVTFEDGTSTVEVRENVDLKTALELDLEALNNDSQLLNK